MTETWFGTVAQRNCFALDTHTGWGSQSASLELGGDNINGNGVELDTGIPREGLLDSTPVAALDFLIDPHFVPSPS